MRKIITIPTELHLRLKVLSAEQGRTLQDVVSEIIEKFLNKEEA